MRGERGGAAQRSWLRAAAPLQATGQTGIECGAQVLSNTGDDLHAELAEPFALLASHAAGDEDLRAQRLDVLRGLAGPMALCEGTDVYKRAFATRTCVQFSGFRTPL
jgi:hypothetical protein